MGVEVTGTFACSSVGFGADFAGGADAGGAAGRRRGGALGAAFLPDVAELMSVDMAHRHRHRVIWAGESVWYYMECVGVLVSYCKCVDASEREHEQ
jgi:hypothetical protein